MLLNRILNVHDGEWSRISFAWLLRFIYRVGFVVGWTVIVAMFVGRYGIASLPYLFVVNAGLTIVGSFIFSFFVDKVKKEHLLMGTSLVGATLLLLGLLVGTANEFWFFALILIAEAAVLLQFKMTLDGYFEQMFNPLESERTFPLIEASETTGGIMGGLLMMTFASNISTESFLIFWMALLVLITPVILVYKSYFYKSHKAPKAEEKPKKGVNFVKNLREELFQAKHASFLKGLLLIVALQWLLYNLLEFQYTKAVYQNVSDVVLDGGSGFEHMFIHELGGLFILFSLSAMLVQLFAGSRMINYLGVMGSILMHTIVTFLGVFGMILNFNFTTAVLAKNNFTITSIIHTNAYHSAYYAIRDQMRDHVRELLEGVVRPLGAVMGTGVLIILQKIFVGQELTLAVNGAMLLVAAVFFFVTYKMQYRYTAVAVDDLMQDDDMDARMDAVGILSQKGHRGEMATMSGVLLDEKEVLGIRLGILRAFEALSHPKSLPAIIKSFESKNAAVRKGALDCLLGFQNLEQASKKNLATSYDLVNALKSLYKKEKSDSASSKIIRLLSRVSNISTLEFLLNVLRKGKTMLKKHAIDALGAYNDPSLVEFIKPYLKSKSVALKGAAAVALGKYDQFAEEVDYLVSSFLRSNKQAEVMQGIFAVGELGLKRKVSFVQKFLDSRSLKLRAVSALALAKLGRHDAEEVLAELMFSRNREIAEMVKVQLKNVDVRISKNIDNIARKIASADAEKAKQLDCRTNILAFNN